MSKEMKIHTFMVDDDEENTHTYQMNKMPALTALGELRFWISIISDLTTKDISEALSNGASTDEVVKHIKVLFKGVLRDEHPVTNIDEVYREDLGEMLITIVNILKINFESMWSGKVQSRLGKIM